MAWFTCADQHRPLGPQTEPSLVKKNKLIFHTMVGSLAGTDAYFRQDGYSGTESHFGVGGYGEIWQWQDTDYQADAQLEGNDDCISVETADKGAPFPAWSGSDVPAWTAAQIEANAQILAEAHRRHGIPLVLIQDTEDATKGVGYHRQGIDPYRKHGEEYSLAFGKVCPGDRRVAQMPQVIARAIQITQGAQKEGSDLPMMIGQDQSTGKIWVIDGNTKLEFPGGSTGPYVTEWLRQMQQAYPSGPAPKLVALNGDILSRVPTVQSLIERDDVDEQALANALAPLLPAPVVDVPADMAGQIATALMGNSAFLNAIAVAVADLSAQRLQA